MAKKRVLGQFGAKEFVFEGPEKKTGSIIFFKVYFTLKKIFKKYNGGKFFNFDFGQNPTKNADFCSET